MSSELSSVERHMKAHGLEATQAAWENHWQSWVTETDIKYLADHGFNSVRIPLGWFSLSDASLMDDTEFSGVKQIYSNCWSAYIQPFVEKCASYNIGVLLDLHCAPGGQNADAHSGTDNKSTRLYSHSSAKKKALKAIQILIDRASSMDNVIGIQALNEPAWGKEQFLEPFYEECLVHARSRGGVPIYIGDCWNLQHWANWVGHRDDFCVVDHHYYYCFSADNHAMSPQAIITDIRESNELASCSAQARGNVIIGEWSLAMDPKSKLRCSAHELDGAQKAFGQTQLNKYLNNSGGCFFWTYKFQVRNNSNEWDVRDMIDRNALPSTMPGQQIISSENVSGQFADLSASKIANHCDYWDNQGGQYEHWRFEDGFKVAWNDSLIFAQSRSRLGFVGEWSRKRRLAHVREKGDSKLVWEFEHGFAAGLEAFASCI